MKENLAIQTERKRLADEYWAGMDEGYDANPNTLPEFFWKPYVNFTARQRGYAFGRELRIQEIYEDRAELEAQWLTLNDDDMKGLQS